MLSDVELKQTETLLLFDHIVNNFDRHNGNILLKIKPPLSLIFIDNSHIIFPELNIRDINIEHELDPANIVSADLFNRNKDIYDLLCYRVGYSEETLLSEATRIQSQLSETTLQKIRNLIPDCWIEPVGQEYIDSMFLVLRHRVDAIPGICETIIRERRR